ncbi:MAG: universal stress protein [Labilithrix sp.]|nr:universal stress protein [Labilithrix sp.]MCW5811512.1 universal stress protein [Labilithrix sp.]
MPATRGAHEPCPIVVGTDFSRPAHNAVARAIQIAQANAATLHVVHASRTLPKALARAFGATSDRTLRAALREALDEARAAGVSARSHLVDAGATLGMSKSIKELKPAIVVVGARGRATRDAFVGSTAERLAVFGGRPVLLVRRPATRPYKEVVIATDVDSAIADGVAAADVVAPAAPRSVVHAYEGPFEHRLRLDGARPADISTYRAQTRQEARATMSKVLRDAGVDESLLHLLHGSAPHVLHRVEANALLVINRHRSLARHLVLGSTTRHVIAYGASDVLIV